MLHYDFSDLVLLVGTNPLPNYVVANFFCARNHNLKRIWLIQSEKKDNQEGTVKLADWLVEVLENECSEIKKKGIEFKRTSISEIGSANIIKNEIESTVVADYRSRTDKSGIHLNYTGGTKAMSVHVYRTLEKQLGDSCTFSYLDAREFRLVMDESDDRTGDLRDLVSISYDNLLRLHGGFEKGCMSNSCTPVLYDRFVQRLTLSDEEFKKAAGAADGNCLENYVANAIQNGINNDEEFKDKKVYVSKNRTICNTSEKRKHFEVDILLVYGYQVYNISCYAGNKEDGPKMRGMEALHRAAQIGGDEGRGILVTLLDEEKVDNLRDDLLTFDGSAKEKLLILGKDDIEEKTLWRRIKDYILQS